MRITADSGLVITPFQHCGFGISRNELRINRMRSESSARPAILRREGMSPGGEEMESLTVRISRSTHAALRALAEETDESMTGSLTRRSNLQETALFGRSQCRLRGFAEEQGRLGGRARRANDVGRRADRRFGGLTADGHAQTGSW